MQLSRLQKYSSHKFVRAYNTDNATPLNKLGAEKTLKHVAHNYHTLPVTLVKGKGIHVWDADGRKYIDFLNGYSSSNHGHCHPKIVKALREQAGRVTQTSRAFYNQPLADAGEYLCKVLKYDKMLPMNTGCEACETAVKIARKWGYVSKKIPDNQAQVILANGSFWGRSITASGASDDPGRYTNFGPYTPGFPLVPYGDFASLEAKLQEIGTTTAAVMLEPVQGESGCKVPPEDYLRKVKDLCKKHNVLLILDEVQTGLGRTGKLMCYEHSGAKPDILVVGKALSGGMLPASAAFANNNIMMNIGPGDHGSTYGGNPLAMHISKVAIETMLEEKMVENSAKMGAILYDKLSSIKNPMIQEVRGKGLFLSIELKEGKHVDGHDFAEILLKRGLTTKATHTYTCRFAPALIINEKQTLKASRIISAALTELNKLNIANRKSGADKK